ncbi:MAG: four helix bundle protein [Bacteroidales bacterium]|nr:four helix bundle protein [Bacteroidales bacterium]
MMQEQIKNRTKQIGLKVIKLIDDLPNKPSAFVIARQIVKSSTSIGANYRAACRAKSMSDFINKLKIVEEETDETLFWLEILEESTLIQKDKISDLLKETNEILSIIVASINTTKKNLKSKIVNLKL